MEWFTRKNKVDKQTKALEKQQKKEVKKAKKLKKKVATTLAWIDIDHVGSDYIELKRKKVIEHVVGIKVTPIAIHLYDYDEQARWIKNYRGVINRLSKYRLYEGYVYSPINCDEQLRFLAEELSKQEDSEQISDLYQCEIDKYRQFATINMELEFFICVKDEPSERLEQTLSDIYREFRRAGFQVSILRRLDYDNMIAYYFNNKMVNDFYFSRGVFEALMTEEGEDKYADVEEVTEIAYSANGAERI